MSLSAFIILLLIGLSAAIAAGAISGIRIGGESLGNELAASMGSLYGAISGLLAVAVGLIVLALV